ncbi:MAG: hypothetical protein IT285_07120 [Bdellovibrionales bacterium]|nr:hypothetical protein [Bdellovibrionales bacterium]
MNPKARQNWFPSWIFPMALALAVGTVWLRLRIIDLTYEIGQTDRTIRNLRLERERTELAVARLRSPMRLERLARSRFQMGPPSADRIIRLGGNRR